jgi:hypothetical protein
MLMCQVALKTRPLFTFQRTGRVAGTAQLWPRFSRVSRVALYLNYAAECLKLAKGVSSAADRRNLTKMAADWCALADTVAKRMGEAKPEKPPPQKPESAPELMAGQPTEPRKWLSRAKISRPGPGLVVRRKTRRSAP